ncbi:hypothetical protein [Stackebrandtia soli]|uniref:hypothetical protein n=1 Tax=Stackebrandtia soli TaxID=1892856 RepID=UPI0039EC684F
MRRIAVAVIAAVASLAIASPAYAYAHDRVHTPWLHTLLDVLTLAVVTSPVWTAFLWGAKARGGLIALIAVVQVPAAVFAFVPMHDPTLHLIALPLGLAITGTSLWYVRRLAKGEAAEPIRQTAAD